MESGDAATAEAAAISTAGPDLEQGAEAGPESDAGAEGSIEQAKARPRVRISRAALLTLSAGLLITAVLAVAALELYNHNETRLLKLRARELSLVLSTAVPTLQTPLASAAELADATGWQREEVPRVHDAAGRALGAPFTSASLWPRRRSHLAPVRWSWGAARARWEARGSPQLFAADRAERSAGAHELLPASPPRLGYDLLRSGRPRRLRRIRGEPAARQQALATGERPASAT